MSEMNIQTIGIRLLTSAKELRYGSVSVTARVHDGGIVDVTFTTTETIREHKAPKEVKK
jgi:hypothetical protein